MTGELIRVPCECCRLDFQHPKPPGRLLPPFLRCAPCRRDCPILVLRKLGDPCVQAEQGESETTGFDPLDW